MFWKKLLGFSTTATPTLSASLTTPAEAVIAKFKEEFLSDGFFNQFDSVHKQSYKAIVETLADEANSMLLVDQTKAAKHIFLNLNVPLLLAYLAKNHYLEKLIKSCENLDITDKYGDTNFSPFHKEIRAFITPRFEAIIANTDNLIKNTSYRFFGYRAEEFTETTNDGYILNLTHCLFFHSEEEDKRTSTELILHTLTWIVSSFITDRATAEQEIPHELEPNQLSKILDSAQEELRQNTFLLSMDDSYRPIYLSLIGDEIESAQEYLAEGNLYQSVIKTIYTIDLAITFNYLTTNKYLSPLLIKHNQLFYTDEYGDPVFEDFERELLVFCRKRLQAIIAYHKSTLNSFFTAFLKGTKNIAIRDEEGDLYLLDTSIHEPDEDTIFHAMNRIVTRVLLSDDNEIPSTDFDSIVSPIVYEKAVARYMTEPLGWEANTTKATGDQGADVIGTKNDIKVVIQCKFYSLPVGNKAIQEAHAAKGFYNADYAAVVTNAAYTKSALQLADSLGVFAIHHDQLQELDIVLFAEN